MPARVLSAEETRILLSRHPEIRPEIIPSWGIRVIDDFTGRVKDYLVGLVHATGEIKALDVTAYDDAGVRIVPEAYWAINWEDIYAKTKQALDPARVGSLGNVLFIGVLVWAAVKVAQALKPSPV